MSATEATARDGTGAATGDATGEARDAGPAAADAALGAALAADLAWVLAGAFLPHRRELAVARRVVGATIVVTLAVLYALIWMARAEAHDAPASPARPQGWSYPLSCCSGIDCRPVAARAVAEGAAGYTIKATGETIGLGDARLKPSPDGDSHWCSVGGSDAGRTLCLFVPPRAF